MSRDCADRAPPCQQSSGELVSSQYSGEKATPRSTVKLVLVPGLWVIQPRGYKCGRIDLVTYLPHGWGGVHRCRGNSLNTTLPLPFVTSGHQESCSQGHELVSVLPFTSFSTQEWGP